MAAKTLWALLCLFFLTPGARAAGLAELQSAAVVEPGRTFDGSLRSGAAPEAGEAKALERPASPPGGRHWAPGPLHPAFKPQAPAAGDAGKADANEGCRGFFRCMGSALLSPITTPFQALLAGVSLGAVVGGKGGFFGSVGGGLLGAVIGLIVGLILAPILLVTGLVKAFGELFKGKL